MLAFLQRHRALRLLLCLVVALVMVWMPLTRPIVVAHAAALSASLIAVVATFLTAIGITFATNDALVKGATMFFNSASATIKNFLTDAATKVNYGTAVLLSIPTAIFTMGMQEGYHAFPKDQTSVMDTVSMDTDWRSYVGITSRDLVLSGKYSIPIPIVLNRFAPNSPNAVSTILSIPESVVSVDRKLIGSSEACVLDTGNSLYTSFQHSFLNPVNIKAYFVCTATKAFFELSLNGTYFHSVTTDFSGRNPSSFNLTSFYFSGASYGQYTGQMNLAAPAVQCSDGSIPVGTGYTFYADSINLSPDASYGGVFTGSGVSAFPTVNYAPDKGICADGVLPGSLNDAMAANPGFVGVDVSIPAAVQDLINAGWQDVITAQQDLIDALLDRIAAQEGTDNPPIVKPGEITKVEVEVGDVVLPDLRLPVGVNSLFPFCIPFDVINGLECFVAEPVKPRFVIPFKYGNVVNEEIVLTIPDWADPVVELIRWGEYMLFVVGLAVFTRNYIKW